MHPAGRHSGRSFRAPRTEATSSLLAHVVPGRGDGAGLAALARPEHDWLPPTGVVPVDGGTWGMRLLPLLEDAGAALLLDAIDAGRAAGTIIVMEREELPRLLGHKLSPHQIDLREVLALGELRGTLPPRLIAIGIQPARVEMSDALSPEVAGERTRLLFVQNAGNLVCPANWDLGEEAKVVVFSVTEGEDKPLTYPKGGGPSRLGPPGLVALRTEIGGNRILDVLPGDRHPRIC
jgi:hydrogenase maturation protease